MLNFLSGVLRDEGGYEYKRAIVEAIFDVIHHIPESKEYGALNVCRGSLDARCLTGVFAVSLLPSLRVHRRLRIHQACSPDLASSWFGRSSHFNAVQVYPLHLQPCHSRKLYRSGCRRERTCAVCRALARAAGTHQCAPEQVSTSSRAYWLRRTRVLTVLASPGVWMTTTTKFVTELHCICESSRIKTARNLTSTVVSNCFFCFCKRVLTSGD